MLAGSVCKTSQRLHERASAGRSHRQAWPPSQSPGRPWRLRRLVRCAGASNNPERGPGGLQGARRATTERRPRLPCQQFSEKTDGASQPIAHSSIDSHTPAASYAGQKMPRADQRLYTALLRLTRRFRAAGLPVLGIAGTDAVCYSLDWPGAVRQQLQHPPLGIGLAGELIPSLTMHASSSYQPECCLHQTHWPASLCCGSVFNSRAQQPSASVTARLPRCLQRASSCLHALSNSWRR